MREIQGSMRRMRAVDVVQRQLDAFVRRDIDAFLSWYEADARLVNATGEILMRGQSDMREQYTKLFCNYPNVSLLPQQRMQEDPWVVDKISVEVGPMELRFFVAYWVVSNHIRVVSLMPTNAEADQGTSGFAEPLAMGREQFRR